MHRSLLAFIYGYRQVTCHSTSDKRLMPHQHEPPSTCSRMTNIGGILDKENKS